MSAHSSTLPPALQPGDTIGIFAPSSWIPAEEALEGKIFLENLGFKVLLHPQTLAQRHQSAGTAQEKADALHDLLKNATVKAIIGARGGNRAMTMLDKIDFGLVAAHPKIVMGYSDMTALLNAIHHKTGLTTYHGPLLRGMAQRDSRDIAQMLSLLGDGTPPRFDFSGCGVLRKGDAEGRLIGGNLSLLASLSGTPYQPDTRGAILFFEDVGDHLSRYDRMLAQMRLAGWFEGIAGLIAGNFTNTGDDPARPFGFTLDEIIGEHLQGLDIPVVMNAPFGHGERLCPLPIGQKARLHASRETIFLDFPR